MSRIVFDRDPFHKRRPIRTNAGKKRREMWSKEQTFCVSCGFTLDLETHHIVKQGRSEEPCNWLRLCRVCHQLAENYVVHRDGMRLPNLSLAHCLWLKRKWNPEEYDFDRLQELRGRFLPEPEEPNGQDRGIRG